MITVWDWTDNVLVEFEIIVHSVSILFREVGGGGGFSLCVIGLRKHSDVKNWWRLTYQLLL